MSDTNFVKKLFDFSFSEFVTPTIIRVLYGIMLAASAIFALVIFIALASRGGGTVVLGIILAPLAFFLYAILARVYMEVLIVLFRIAENSNLIAQNTRRELPPPPPADAPPWPAPAPQTASAAAPLTPPNSCPSCGRALAPGAPFCTGCGARVST